MKYITTLSFSLLLLLAVFTTAGFAQDATVTASGTVLEPLSVTGTNLSFGAEIFPGINESVSKTDAGAAQFDITGEAGKEITADFTLPTELSKGEDALTITFSSTDAGHATTEAGTATDFDPSSTLTTSLEATDGTLFIWLGGTVEPTETQPAGEYTADITLDTAYTGD